MKIIKRNPIVEKSSNYKLDWPSIVFYADLTGEKFEKVSIITLISEYDAICHEEAICKTPYPGNDIQWYKEIHKTAIKIMDSGEIKVSEIVKIDENYNALVILDNFEINDDSLKQALKLLEKIDNMETLPLSKSFGDPISFTSEQVSFHTNALRRINEIYIGI